MTIPDEFRSRLTAWCASLLRAEERDRRRIGFTTVGRNVTILDRRPPVLPEPGAAWSSRALAQLRADTPHDGRWTLCLPGDDGERWLPQEPSADDPFALLERIEGAIRSIGPSR